MSTIAYNIICSSGREPENYEDGWLWLQLRHFTIIKFHILILNESHRCKSTRRLSSQLR